MVAPIEHQNLRSCRDVARQANREAIRIGRGEGELPVRQPKPLLQLFAHDNGIFAWHHQRDAAPRLLLHGRNCGRRRVSCHGSGITQAEIDVAVAIDIEELRATRLAHKGRKRTGPLRHPVHGHATQQGFARALKQRRGFRPVSDELLLLALHERLQTCAVNGAHDSPELSRSWECKRVEVSGASVLT